MTNFLVTPSPLSRTGNLKHSIITASKLPTILADTGDFEGTSYGGLELPVSQLWKELEAC